MSNFIPQTPADQTYSGDGNKSIKLIDNILKVAQPRINDIIYQLDYKADIFYNILPIETRTMIPTTEKGFAMLGIDAVERTAMGGEIVQGQEIDFLEYYIGSRIFDTPIKYPRKKLEQLLSTQNSGGISLGQKLMSEIPSMVSSAYKRSFEDLIIYEIRNAKTQGTLESIYKVFSGGYDPTNYTRGYILNGAGEHSDTPADISINLFDVIKSILKNSTMMGVSDHYIGICSDKTLRKIRALENRILLNGDFMNNKNLISAKMDAINYGSIDIFAPTMSKDPTAIITDNEMYFLQTNSMHLLETGMTGDTYVHDMERDQYKWYYRKEMGCGVALPHTMIKVIIN